MNLALPLFKGTLEDQACVFALEGNIQIVTVIIFFFQSKLQLWSNVFMDFCVFWNEDEQLVSSDEVVNFDDVKPG